MEVAFPSGSDLRSGDSSSLGKKEKDKQYNRNRKHHCHVTHKKVGHAIFSSSKFRDKPAICSCKDENGTRKFIQEMLWQYN